MIFPQFTQLFDSHCHLNEVRYDDDRDAVIERVNAAGVSHVLDIGVNVASSHKAVENAKQYPGKVFAVIGIDPEVLTPGNDLYLANLIEEQPGKIDSGLIESGLIRGMGEVRDILTTDREHIAAIGETGMDNYWIKKLLDDGKLSAEEHTELLALQAKLFRMHLELAVESRLPLSIHSRGAEQQCLEIVREFWQTKGIFHSYTGSYEIAKGILDAGWGLGVNGIITYKNSQDLKEMYRRLLGKVSRDWSPQDFYERGIYFETDGPYLAPEPRRGERSEPADVKVIYESFIQTLCTT